MGSKTNYVKTKVIAVTVIALQSSIRLKAPHLKFWRNLR